MKKLKLFYRRVRYFFSARKSYAQHGEDLALEGLAGHTKRGGYYVDIGAHHPYRFSNTRLFYKKGWRGINIDAMPGSMKPFRIFRRRDVNLEMGVGREKSILKFYCFEEPAYNTFSGHLVNDEAFLKRVPLKKVVDVPVLPLKDILQQHLPANTAIDFISVDAEGFDLDVLKSNDWKLYRPTHILVEEKLEPGLPLSEIGIYLKEQGYSLISRLYITSIYETTVV